MRKFLGYIFERIATWLNKGLPQQENLEKKEADKAPPFSEEIPIIAQSLPKIKEAKAKVTKKGKIQLFLM